MWHPKSKEVYIIANGRPPTPSLLKQLSDASLIAVDGGLAACMRLNLHPDLIVGDFDSLSKELLKHFSNATIHPLPDQSKTDLEKTLEFLEPFKLTTITIFGAIGERLDHTLANICLLCRYPAKVKFETEYETCFVLPKKITISCTPGQIVSFIPLNGDVSHVVSLGLKWELADVTFNKQYLSISNQCLHSTFTISYGTGDLLICLSKI